MRFSSELRRIIFAFTWQLFPVKFTLMIFPSFLLEDRTLSPPTHTTTYDVVLALLKKVWRSLYGTKVGSLEFWKWSGGGEERRRGSSRSCPLPPQRVGLFSSEFSAVDFVTL